MFGCGAVEQGSTERPGTIIIVRGGQGQRGLYTTLPPELLSQAGTVSIWRVSGAETVQITISCKHGETSGDNQPSEKTNSSASDQSRVGPIQLLAITVTSD